MFESLGTMYIPCHFSGKSCENFRFEFQPPAKLVLPCTVAVLGKANNTLYLSLNPCSPWFLMGLVCETMGVLLESISTEFADGTEDLLMISRSNILRIVKLNTFLVD